MASAGDNTLASYEYGDNNGKLLRITYGNGFYERYVYNELDLISKIYYNKNGEYLAYSYEYTADGEIYKFTDHINERVTVYTYNTSGNITSFTEYSLSDFEKVYTEELHYNGHYDLGRVVQRIAYGTTEEKIIYTYSYTADKQISRVEFKHGNETKNIFYTYDGYGRLTFVDGIIADGKFGWFANAPSWQP